MNLSVASSEMLIHGKVIYSGQWGNYHRQAFIPDDHYRIVTTQL